MKRRSLYATLAFSAYWITIAFSCTYRVGPEAAGPTDCANTTLSISASAVAAPCNQASGSITATASGGAGQFKYSLDGANFQTEGVFTNLASGSYTVTVEDASKCTKTSQVEVTNASNLSLALVATDKAACGVQNGGIKVSSSGGSGAVSFTLDGTKFQASGEFANLAPGKYTVTAKDAGGCTTFLNAEVSTAISYQTNVKSIIATNCAVQGCHVSNNFLPLVEFSAIKAQAANIKAQVVSKAMPKGGKLSDEAIKSISCWVDAGAPDN